MSEPAILVKRKHRASQVWAMEKFENKIIDMRDLYEDWKERGGGGGGGDAGHDDMVAMHERLIVVRNGVVVRLRFLHRFYSQPESRHLLVSDITLPISCGGHDVCGWNQEGRGGANLGVDTS